MRLDRKQLPAFMKLPYQFDMDKILEAFEKKVSPQNSKFSEILPLLCELAPLRYSSTQ